MTLDAKGLDQTFAGKTLRVWFSNDEVALIRVNGVEVHEDCELCPGYAGVIFDLVEANRPERYEKEHAGSLTWSKLSEIEKWELVNEG
jgi:hypothetical protein